MLNFFPLQTIGRLKITFSSDLGAEKCHLILLPIEKVGDEKNIAPPSRLHVYITDRIYYFIFCGHL